MYTTEDRVAEALAFTGWRDAELPKEKLAEFADAASGEVDSKIRLVYTVPLSDPPALIEQITVALAAYQATLTYYGSTDLDDKDPVVRRWKWASDLLEQIRKGEVSLGIGDDSGTSTDDDGGTVVNPEYSGTILPEFFADTDRAPQTFGGWDRSYAFRDL